MKKIEFENINHNKILIITDIHHCDIDKWGGVMLEERMRHLTENVNRQYKKTHLT